MRVTQVSNYSKVRTDGRMHGRDECASIITTPTTSEGMNYNLCKPTVTGACFTACLRCAIAVVIGQGHVVANA